MLRILNLGRDAVGVNELNLLYYLPLHWIKDAMNSNDAIDSRLHY